VITLAEEERVAAAVGDIRQADAAADEEDAVLAQTGEVRQAARQDRPRPGITAIAADPVDPTGPQGDGIIGRELPDGCWQPVGRAN
jgi:hypothetical protein